MPLSKTPYFMLSTGSNKETRPDITEKVFTGKKSLISTNTRKQLIHTRRDRSSMWVVFRCDFESRTTLLKKY